MTFREVFARFTAANYCPRQRLCYASGFLCTTTDSVMYRSNARRNIFVERHKNLEDVLMS